MVASCSPRRGAVRSARREAVRSARRRAVAASVLAALLLAGGIASPALAVPDGSGVGVTDPPGPATEATIVEMLHQGGLFGGDVTVDPATTPYPTSGITNFRPVETAQIVLDDPGVPGRQDLLTYCIDLATETEIGVHYELGDWTAANVPNLAYVTHILENYYPAVPGAPSTGTDVEKVQAVQGAIWYFTDSFVVPTSYPSEHNAIKAIVDATLTEVNGPPPAPAPAPVPPTLTLTPDAADAPTTGQLVGPFAVGGNVASSTLGTSGVEVFADAAGTIPVLPGDSVAQGAELWARYVSTTSTEGFTLSAVESVVEGNVFLYDGGNPGRTSAQKLILAVEANVPVRTAAVITPFAAGTLQVDVAIAGAAAGSQSAVTVEARCDTGGTITTATGGAAAASAAGTYAAIALTPLAAGTVCTVSTTASGANSSASLASSTTVPASVTIADLATGTIVVSQDFAVPAPTPTPTPVPAPAPTPPPTPASLPDTGGGAALPWAVPFSLIAGGLALVLFTRRGAVSKRRPG